MRWALEQGYRPMDCASIYGNEAGIGTALSEAITTGVVDKGLEPHIGVSNFRAAARAIHPNHSGTDAGLIQSLIMGLVVAVAAPSPAMP